MHSGVNPDLSFFPKKRHTNYFTVIFKAKNKTITIEQIYMLLSQLPKSFNSLIHGFWVAQASFDTHRVFKYKVQKLSDNQSDQTSLELVHVGQNVAYSH